ncbi:uncharacterized protein LOC112588630 [Harpegnathos saltator]|uniref:uncharacterized protein LOC112588630 n=1 Tax=Harpegnathos saltator TaxID=610380 RepID=UPI000DBEDA22|nr:uncharacterized protein LOC112588630 [Harpegnathos saltator]
MPFGLKNAPATFQRLMDNVLSGLQGNELFVYMDDIVIYANSLHEHEIKFNKLMNRLQKANLKLQPDKCEFLRREVAYLGHIIGSDGVRPDPEKIKSIKEFPTPRTQKQIKQFLGLAGYYRRFIPDFSKTAKPLTDLLKKDKEYIWRPIQQHAFNILRESLCSHPILQYPDFTKPFNLTTDASGYAIGGVLSQGPIGQDLPIAYTSRVLNPAEQNYSTIEKECLAIVYCVQYFRPYLYGQKFKIITDHKPLMWLQSIKDPSSRLWKWKTKLAEYEYEIQYKKGTLNSNADALSRNPIVTTLPLNFNNEDSNESLFTFPPEQQNPNTNESVHPSSSRDTPDPVPVIEPPRVHTPVILQNTHVIPEIDTDDESLLSDHLDDSSDSSEEIFDALSIPAEIGDIVRNPTLLKVKLTRDSLMSQKDNHVVFIKGDGTPFDNGSNEYEKTNKLPSYTNIILERAKVNSIGKNVLISLPVKLDDRIMIEHENIKNCIKSLVDVVNEMQLKSFSIRRTHYLDAIPWDYVQRQILKHFEDTSLRITICEGVIQTPKLEDRENLILENHASALGGHKGVTKTYNRLRMSYYWNTMKRDVQAFIQQCRTCQLKKLTRVKIKQPMVITDTPGAAFDKISMDIMGPLPITDTGNSYILTIQDLLTKYSLAIPLAETTSLTIADAFVKHFICIYGAPRALLTDQGSNFLTSLMKNIARKFGIQQYKTTAYHPQSNGSIERSHHVLMEYLKTQITRDTNWDEHLHLAMFSYNTSIHERCIGYEINLGAPQKAPRNHSSYPTSAYLCALGQKDILTPSSTSYYAHPAITPPILLSMTIITHLLFYTLLLMDKNMNSKYVTCALPP